MLTKLTGAPGYVTSTLMNGMSFVSGWEAYFFVSKWSMHQMVCGLYLLTNNFELSCLKCKQTL